LRAIRGNDVEVLAWRARGTSPVLNTDMTVREGADLETTYGVRSFERLEDALAERPSVAFITNPNTLHLPTALAAARAGCHLFIEKPVSHTLDGVDELVREVRERNLVAFVAYQFRFHQGLQLLKRCIDEGRLGRLTSAHIVNAEYLPGWHPYEDYRQTHPARRDLGGGCLNIQTHEIDYALWLFGMPRRVYASGGHLSGLEVDVEDTVDILLDCPRPDGRAFPVHIHLDYLERPPQRVCEVVGDAGKARFDYYANRAETWETKGGDPEIHGFEAFERNQMFLDELKHFFECVEGRATSMIGLDEGLRSVAISVAAKESLALGCAVEVGVA
jgi:predicted dehydrogenase